MANRYNDYAIIEIGYDHWILVQVLRVTSTLAAAWRVLGNHRRRCVVETDDGEWAACLLSAVLTDRQDGHQLLMRIPDAVLLFEAAPPPRCSMPPVVRHCKSCSPITKCGSSAAAPVMSTGSR